MRCRAGGPAAPGPSGRFEFREAEYRAVAVRLMEASQDPRHRSVLLLHDARDSWDDFFREGGAPRPAPPAGKGFEYMLVEIGGDAAVNIAQLLQVGPQGYQHGRPLALDLLWKVLGRGRELSSKDWELARTAIVDLRDNIFIGRMFFGTAASGDLWDCDCRPSDGIWMALRSQKPVYVHEKVWAAAKSSVQDEPRAGAGAGARKKMRAAPDPAGPGAAEAPRADLQNRLPGTKIVTEDPEPIKLLKRELDVAVSEEDYEAAARIRDSKLFVLHQKVAALREAGDTEAADEAEVQLHGLLRELNDSNRSD